MRKTKKAIASLAIAGMVLSMAPMSVFGATTDSTRLGGAGRVETAIAIAAQGWTTSDSVVVVPADDANTVDALAAAPLAGQLNAPILLTYKDTLDPQVQQKIKDLGAKKVYAVGALSADTVASLKAISGVDVTLLQGADRTDTAAKVAAELTGVKGTFVVAYNGIADALSAASYAAANDYSIVVANPDGTIPSTEKVTAPVYTVGGQVKYDGATALAGTDRYDTNNKVVDGLTYKFDTVYVANGQNPVDALAGAPLAAKTNSPIVLGDAVGVATGAVDNLTSTSKVIALGGSGAVSDSVLAKIAYQAPATLAVESVSAINAKQIQVTFNTEVDSTTAKYLGNYYIQNNTDAAYVALSTKDAAATIALDSTKTIATITFSTDVNTAVGAGTIAGTPFNFKVSGVQNAAGVALATAYTTQLSCKDTVAPTVVSATATAKTTTTTLTLAFSEPVQTTGAIVYVDGKAGVVQAGSKITELKVTTAQNLTAGTTYPVTVLNVVDFGGNFLATNPTNTNVTVVSDTATPVLNSVVVKTDRVLEATFSKAVDVNTFNGSVRLVDAAGNAYAGNAGILTSYPDAANKAVVDITLPAANVLTFNDSNVYVGTIYFTGSVTDLSGNALVATSQAITVNKDVVAPTLVSSKFIAPGTVYTNSLPYPQGAIVLKMSEDVTYNAGTIQVLDKNGAIVAPATFDVPVVNVNDASEVIVPVAAGQTLSAGTYTVITPSALVKDQSFATTSSTGATNTVTVSTSGDTTKPVVVTPIAGVTAATGLTSGTSLQVSFTDNAGLDLQSIMNVSNYLLNGLPLPAGSYVTNNITTGTASAATAVTATINLPAGSIKKDSATNVLNVVNVKDLNGNVVAPVAFSAIALKDDIAPTLTTATIASNGTLLLGFSETVTAAAAANLADFDLTLNGTKVNAGLAALGTTIAQGVGTDAGKYVLTLNGQVDAGADGNALTTADNRVYLDVDGIAGYTAGTDILVKTGTTTAVGATTVSANDLSSVKVSTIATPSVVKDTATAVAGGYVLVDGTTITVK